MACPQPASPGSDEGALDAATIYEPCAAASHNASEHDDVVDLARDDLDHSIWLRLKGEASSRTALAALTDYGRAAPVSRAAR
jgi:hypothetical protein